jgi:hypothetical protein
VAILGAGESWTEFQQHFIMFLFSLPALPHKRTGLMIGLEDVCADKDECNRLCLW